MEFLEEFPVELLVEFLVELGVSGTTPKRVLNKASRDISSGTGKNILSEAPGANPNAILMRNNGLPVKFSHKFPLELLDSTVPSGNFQSF